MPERRARRRPESECAIDMEPGAALACRGRDLRDRIERAGIHVPRLRADDAEARRRSQRRGKFRRAHAALLVGRDALQPLRAEAQHPKRGEDRVVRLVAHDDVNRWRAEQPLRVHIPAGVGEQMLTRRRQTREVRHLAAGDESHAPRGRQPGEIAEPRRGDLFDDRHDRRQRVDAAVLIPRGRRESRPRWRPAGCRRRRTRSTGDPGSRRCHEARHRPAGRSPTRRAHPPWSTALRASAAVPRCSPAHEPAAHPRPRDTRGRAARRGGREFFPQIWPSRCQTSRPTSGT